MGFLGIGESDYNAVSFTDTRAYKPNAFQYGGYAGGAQDERANLEWRRAGIDARGAPGIDTARGDQSRGLQMGSLAHLQRAAEGTSPSRAEILGNRMADQSLRSQVSAAGNVRGGPGASAAAYRYQAQNAAAQRAGLAQQIQAERAGEMATARGALAGATAGLRGQDDAFAFGRAGHDLASRNANDARAMGYEGWGQDVSNNANTMRMGEQAIASDAYNQAAALNQATAQGEAANSANTAGSALQAVGSLAGAAAKTGSDERMKNQVPIGSLAHLELGGQDKARIAGSDPNWEVSQRRRSGGYADPNADPRDMSGPGGALAQIEKDTAGADPYTPSHEVSVGVAGAPKGYAAGREGQPGSMFGYSPDVDASVPGVTGNRHTEAPGSRDWRRYGAGAVDDAEPDWTKGGTTKRSPQPEAWRKWIPDFKRFIPGQRDTTTSDDQAKIKLAQKQAFADGVAHTQGTVDSGVAPPFPAYLEADKRKPRTAEITSPRMLETTLPSEIDARAASTTKPDAHVYVSRRGAPAGEPRPVPLAPPPPVPMPAAPAAVVAESALKAGVVGAVRGGLSAVPRPARSTTTSDERAKDIDGKTLAMADAARAMEPAAYAYKSEHLPPGQAPGEVNVGPMANKMARDPVARTAIVKGEDDLLQIDKEKGLKLVMGSLAALQAQIDAMSPRKGKAA